MVCGLAKFISEHVSFKNPAGTDVGALRESITALEGR
jgi:hypothetical protein